jgi:hypothetical protein
MTAEQLRKFQQTQPFEPFAIHLADVRVFTISHPDAISIEPRGRAATVLNQDGLLEVADMLLITSLRPLKARHSKPKR